MEVAYEMTALSHAGAQHLEQFETYIDYVQSWLDAIAECLAKRAAA